MNQNKNISLRPYQTQAIEHIRHALRIHPKALAVLATGAGKTVILAKLVESLLKTKPDFKILFIVHKIILSTQIEETLKQCGVACGVYCGSLNRYELNQITVGLYQSLAGQPNLGAYDFVVVDECHRLSDSYHDIIKRVSHDRTRILGVTATPYAAKGFIYGKDQFWPKPCFTKGLAELTNEGWLVRAMTTAPVDRTKWVDTKGLKLVGGDFSQEQVNQRAVRQELVEVQVADALPKLRGRSHIAWMCCTIEHARMVEMELAALGQTTTIITSEETGSSRQDSLDRFLKGRARHLIFIIILAEGFDAPLIDALVILRPTRSPTLYLQSVGRTLRTHEDKSNALILDYGGVIEALGPIDNPVVLEPREGNHEKKLLTRSLAEQWMQCGECGAFFSQDIENPKKCPECGADPRKSDIKERLKKLKKVSSRASLYSGAGSIEWSIVRAYSFHKADTHIDFFFDTDSGKKQFRLDTPVLLRKPTPMQMGKIRKAKRYLELFFGCHGSSMQEKLIHLGESSICPKLVACQEGTAKVIELSDPHDPNAPEQPADRAEQERLL